MADNKRNDGNGSESPENPQKLERQIAFLDLEASGLGAKSWPIEVGWGFVGWEPRSMLIKPSPHWHLSAWQKSAEELHKISVDMLLREGKPPLEVALILNAALANSDVYSDAPDYDGFWLYRLYEAAGVRANFQLLDLNDLLSPLVTSPPAELVAKADKIEQHTHRAAQDVRHMLTLYKLALEENQAR